MIWKKLLSSQRGKQLVGETYSSSKPSYDLRTEIDRDYGRAVFATAVRRLQDKAQVFPLEPNDFVRTRLTHSLEVSTMSRSLAKQVGKWLVEKREVTEEEASAIETAAATCGLLHDIGNPPFGHSGEDAIRDWFLQLFKDDAALANRLGGQGAQQSSDFLLFEGNAQTFRLITRLQVLADRHGLNLTAATLSASGKYVAQSNEVTEADKQRSKVGFFTSEQNLIDLLREETGTGAARNPIAYIVEAADDMTYATVDLEDAVRKGILSWEILLEELPKADPSIRKLLDRCDEYLIRNGATLVGASRDEARVQLFRTFAMYDHVSAAAEEFKRSYEDIMSGTYKAELLENGESKALLKACRSVAKRYVYPSKGVVRLEVMGRNVIHRLMSAFWGGVRDAPPKDKDWWRTFPGKTYSLMSESYRRVFEEDVATNEKVKGEELPIDYRRLQLVADYVAGMTDTFAITLANNLEL